MLLSHAYEGQDAVQVIFASELDDDLARGIGQAIPYRPPLLIQAR